MINFSFADISILSWILLALTVVIIAVAFLIGWNPAIRTLRYSRRGNTPADSDISENIPSASVIVLSTDNEERIDEYLQQLEAQQHPDFEIIVVCEATTADRSAALKDFFSSRYPNIHITFVPPESINLSRRKLALTIGLKAATKEVAVLTRSNSTIASTSWLAEMCRPFIDPSIEMVLGYAPTDFSTMEKGVAYRAFDSTMTDAQWLGYAIAHKAYRGDGHNMALRIDTFFRHKGFGKSMFLESGDDDLFVSEVANRDNTAVCLSADSRVIMSYGSITDKIWKSRKDQYNFTSRYLSKGPFLRASLLSWCQWLAPTMGVAAAISALSSLIPLIAVILILAAFWTSQSLLYKRLATALGTNIGIKTPVNTFMLWRPIGNALFRLARHNKKFRHYTWKRK